MEDRMEFANEDERLIAEQAVLSYRELIGVMKAAPHGQGLAVVERAVREKGFAQMRDTLSRVLGAHQEAQKKGQTAGPVPAAHRPISRGARRRSC
jgi:hypothetical protein